MEEQEEVSLKELVQKAIFWWKYLLSKWKIILIIGVVGVLLGLGYSYIKKPIYNATLTFALEEKGSSGSGIGAIASQFGFDIGGGNGGIFAGDNIIELLKSRYLIEKTLLTKAQIEEKENLLVNRFITFNKFNETWSKDPLLSGLKFTNNNRETFSLQQDSVLELIYKVVMGGMLNVSKIDKKLSIISVSVTSQDELFAKLFCENLVRNVTNFYIETKTSKSRANVALLEHRVDSVRRELDNAIYSRAQLSDQNLGLVRQQAAVPKIKQELKVQMLSAMYGELIKNLEFSKLALMREEPLIQVIDHPILPLEKKQLGKIKGGILGGVLLFFLTIVYLVLKRILYNVMNTNS